jgi:hypothetical protein
MKNNLLRIFGRASDKATLALPAPESDKLINATRKFEKARFSDRCRTISFLNVSGNSEFLTGQADAKSGQWTIRKVTEEPNITGDAKPVGEPSLSFKTIKEDMSFYDMIKYCSTYERGQIALNIPQTGDTENTADHFQDIAEREGLIFDVSGAPHPTLNGEIITDGTFAKADIERLRAYSKKNSARFFDGNDLISHFINPVQKMNLSLASVTEKSAALNVVHDTTESLEDTRKILECLFQKDIWSKDMGDILTCNYTRIDQRLSDLDKYYYHDDDVYAHHRERSPDYAGLRLLQGLIKKYSGIDPTNCFEKMQKKLDSLVPALPFDAERIKTISTILGATKLYFDVMQSRYRLERFDQNSADYVDQLKKIQENLPAYQNAFKKLGTADADLWKLESAILDNGTPGSLSVLQDLAAQLAATEKAMTEGLQRDKNAVVAGPYLG